MTKNLIPKLIDALRINVPDVAAWAGVSKWVARDWSLDTRQPQPAKRAKLVVAVRKHVAGLLALVENVEREGSTRSARAGSSSRGRGRGRAVVPDKVRRSADRRAATRVRRIHKGTKR